MPKTKSFGDYQRLRTRALHYPKTREDSPWGECAIKVRGKTFLFMRETDAGLSLSVKLPQSREFALDRPFAAPTRYGLGKSGWVTSSFGPGDAAPLDVLAAWLDESYPAVAPKTLVKQLQSSRAVP